ncbi:MAG: biopolymer transporter ExbD [Gammaproteobacteria bacterium]|nr:biopolymer transporter ExbD [Gammaproteobacteria bacterium]MDH3506245.1 biopolymer transporter ExbD [Gammaproteobacteria bacterium]
MTVQRQREEDEIEINITPMLDIVFIMLIFFIVTTSFVKEPGISPQRPSAETAVEKTRGNVLIAISQTDQIWMDKRSVELNQVRALVEAALAENPESSAVIIADSQANSGILIDLMDQIRLGGIGNISIAAEPSG